MHNLSPVGLVPAIQAFLTSPVLATVAFTFKGNYRKHVNLATGQVGASGGAGADLTFVEASTAVAANGYRDIALRVTKAAGVTALKLRAGSADMDDSTSFAGDPNKALLFAGTARSLRLEAA